MFDGKKREYRCDRIGCEVTAAAPDGTLPSGWGILSQDLKTPNGFVHAWWTVCPACKQLLSVTTR